MANQEREIYFLRNSCEQLLETVETADPNEVAKVTRAFLKSQRELQARVAQYEEDFRVAPNPTEAHPLLICKYKQREIHFNRDLNRILFKLLNQMFIFYIQLQKVGI